MGELSPIHWLIVIAIIVLLFGGKRIPEVMKGMGEGVRNFKEGMRGPEAPTGAPVATQIAAPPAQVISQTPAGETTTVIVTPDKK